MSDTARPRALVVIHHDAFALQGARWARMLKRHGAWEPVIYITADYLDRHLGACRAEGITVLGAPPAAASGAPDATSAHADAHPAARGRLRRALTRIPALPLLVNGARRSLVLTIPATVARMRRDIGALRAVLRNERISAVLLAESGPDFAAPLFVEAAHQEGIPVVTSPIEISTARDYAEAYLTGAHLSLDRWVNRFIAARYPRWVITHKRRQMVRSDARILLALEWLGLSPPHPWLIVGNREDRVAVEGEAMFYHYLAEGVAPSHMVVVGRAEHDIMHEVVSDAAGRRQALYARLGLDPALPLLLSPLVQEHYATGRPECDFQNYADMVDFWVESLAAVKAYNVVITLHPGHTYQQDSGAWDRLEERGVKICRDDLPELVPLCDVYVTGGSTTTSWAIACGKPVINYDIYRHGAHMVRYRSAPGVLSTQEQDEFRTLLSRLTGDPAYHAEISERQAVSAGQWGRLDGKAAERLTRIFDALAGARSSRMDEVAMKRETVAAKQ